MKLFDIGLLLSRWEGFGLVIPEYMMAQVPIVASKIDAIPDLIVDHQNGLLVPVDSPETTAEVVIELLKNKTLAKKLVENGYKDVNSKFDIKRVAREHESIFEKILNE